MWEQLAIFAVTLVVGYLVRPKVKFDSPKPGEVDVRATASAGGVIPVLFGTREIKGQNIVWYGDIKTQAIKKKGGKK